MTKLTEIWDRAHEAILENNETNNINHFKEEYLWKKEVRLRHHLKHAWEILEMVEMMKKDLNITDIIDYIKKRRDEHEKKEGS